MIRVGSIVIRVDDLQRQTAFWAAALGYVPRDDPSGPDADYVVLADPEGNRFCVFDDG
jgi:catechol 2,3-dioxygenase-like lactoylglutathione lyase family enzyme